MKQIGYAVMLLLFTGVGCSDQEPSSCVMGTVVGYEYCTNAVLISVEAQFKIGEDITYYDQSAHENVVRAPGKFGEYGTAKLFFKYRSYDAEADQQLFDYSASPCPALYGPFNVPTVVVTKYSTTGCN